MIHELSNALQHLKGYSERFDLFEYDNEIKNVAILGMLLTHPDNTQRKPLSSKNNLQSNNEPHKSQCCPFHWRRDLTLFWDGSQVSATFCSSTAVRVSQSEVLYRSSVQKSDARTRHLKSHRLFDTGYPNPNLSNHIVCGCLESLTRAAIEWHSKPFQSFVKAYPRTILEDFTVKHNWHRCDQLLMADMFH